MIECWMEYTCGAAFPNGEQSPFYMKSYKSCMLNFKARQKGCENSSKWYIEEVVQIMLMDTPKTLYSNGKILYNKNNKPRRGTTDEEGEYSYGQVCREAGQDRHGI